MAYRKNPYPVFNVEPLERTVLLDNSGIGQRWGHDIKRGDAWCSGEAVSHNVYETTARHAIHHPGTYDED